jgi:hypothetical protein
MEVREMSPFTYDQAEFVLVLIWPVVYFLIFVPVYFIPWDECGGMPASVSLIYDSLWLGIIAPLATLMDWSIKSRPGPLADFAHWYFNLWGHLAGNLK